MITPTERRARRIAFISLAVALVGVALVFTGAGSGAVLLTGGALMNATRQAAKS